jgi:hypothetical protein
METVEIHNVVRAFTRAGAWGGSGGQDPPSVEVSTGGRPPHRLPDA